MLGRLIGDHPGINGEMSRGEGGAPGKGGVDQLLAVGRAQDDVGAGQFRHLLGLAMKGGIVAGPEAGGGGEGAEGGAEAVEVAVDDGRDLPRGGQRLERIALALDRGVAQQQHAGEGKARPEQQQDEQDQQDLGGKPGQSPRLDRPKYAVIDRHPEQGLPTPLLAARSHGRRSPDNKARSPAGAIARRALESDLPNMQGNRRCGTCTEISSPNMGEVREGEAALR